MPISNLKDRVPGWLAGGFAILFTSMWTYWGVAELYYEGWGLPFPQPLFYLVPATACLLFSLLAWRWPRLGGWVLIGAGGAFTVWWWDLAGRRAGGLTLALMLSLFPVSGLLVVSGFLFLAEGRYRRRLAAVPIGWLRRNWFYVLELGLCGLIAGLISAFQLPVLLSRYDDGERGSRQIEGNGVTLVWAPRGPGWNWRQPWGGYPPWTALALYGQPPLGLDDKGTLTAPPGAMAATGLCAYLSADGLTLADTPQQVWRMPTVDELVRSLNRDGQNAGCAWTGQTGRMVCPTPPDKETPLWDPTAPPIYYWAADELDTKQAYYVSYNGWVNAQPKLFGNPRHGYRCVREP